MKANCALCLQAERQKGFTSSYYFKNYNSRLYVGFMYISIERKKIFWNLNPIISKIVPVMIFTQKYSATCTSILSSSPTSKAGYLNPFSNLRRCNETFSWQKEVYCTENIAWIRIFKLKCAAVSHVPAFICLWRCQWLRKLQSSDVLSCSNKGSFDGL